jgi:cytochrome c peroxidase
MFKYLPLVTLMALAACGGSETPAEKPDGDAQVKTEPEKKEPIHTAIFKPLPKEPVAGPAGRSEALVDLGRMLYYDTRISKNHDISCNSCHMLDKFGVDGEPTSPGHKGVRGDRNSPTTYNASLHFAQFWDGREPTVEAQALGPVTNPVEMAIPTPDYAVKVIKSMPGYVEAFEKAFPDDEDPVTFENFGKAVGAFERGLITRGKFDAYLEGDASALSDAEVEGLDTFVKTGCVSCHNGQLLGGNAYQKLGAVKPYETEDLGRFKVTNNEADKYMFKVPSLRNIAETGPYLHDGSVASLADMIRIMGEHQLGKELDDETVGKIETFMGALTGEVPTDYIAKPELPESTDSTPKADPS